MDLGRPTVEEVKRQMDGEEVWVRHPEVFHYTSPNVLESMLEHEEIWAFSALHQSDPSELTAFWQGLGITMQQTFTAVISKLASDDDQLQAKINASGGPDAVAAKEAQIWEESLASPLFCGDDGSAMMRPFITCFSTHSEKTDIDAYRRDNGSRSQWQSYAADGVAIVFDTEKLHAMVTDEWNSFDLSVGVFQPVHYGPTNKIHGMLRQYYANLLAENVLCRQEPFGEDFEALADYLARAVLLSKHTRYIEEHECRIALTLPTTHHLDELVQSGRLPEKGLKPVYSHKDCRPYIRLFERLQEPLPIKRIIVGPSKQQTEILRRVAAVIGDRCNVDASDTPWH